MTADFLKRGLSVCAVLLLPAAGFAQEAIIAGTITDSTGAVLPGVTVVADHEATGNRFEAVTDALGIFRLAVRIGGYRISAELPGFGRVERSGVELLVGQTATINMQMAPSTVQETVTVTGEAPLLDVTSSQVAGNIDSRQMSELPVLGRNPLELMLMAPGARQNQVEQGTLPMIGGGGTLQLNIDGLQVTNNIVPSGARNTSFGREAIAEFQLISNRFDATQGRSSGVQVNVVTRSGTNTPSGSLSGYFRDDRLNAADFIEKRVLPYSSQQLAMTGGGPIRRDRAHFFVVYEFEREPKTVTHNTPFPSFNIDVQGVRQGHKPTARLDLQFSSATRLSVSGWLWRDTDPVDTSQGNVGGATNHPINQHTYQNSAEAGQATLTRVIGNRALNELKVGWAANRWFIDPSIKWTNPTTGLANARDPRANELQLPPLITFNGFNIGGGANFPQRIGQHVGTLRNDFTYSYEARGRHDLRTGGEYLRYQIPFELWCNFLRGNLRVDRGPLPRNLEALFPVWNDPGTWNLGPLSPITRDFQISGGNCAFDNPRNIFAFWAQDDWQITSRLTLNIGVRYDFETGVWANEVAVPPFLEGGRPDDTDNIVPRLGFAYGLNARTVIRGGVGKYFAEVNNQSSHPIRVAHQQRVINVLNDGRPDFAVNPWNGPLPAFDVLEQRFCNVNFVAGCFRRAIGQSIAGPDYTTPHAWHVSIGVQRQIGVLTALTADYAYKGQRHRLIPNYNINLAFDPATGLNYPFSDISRRPFPDWAQVPVTLYGGRDNYHSLDVSFTRRLSDRWQAGATYTLSGYWDGVPGPWSGLSPVPFPVQAPLGAEYGLAETDQRHRAVVNGIWELGYGFQLSGLYFFGAGSRFQSYYGGDALNTGATGVTQAARPASTRARPASVGGGVVPRNDIVGDALHRVDLRLQKRFALIGRARVDGIAEVFNLFNHENYGSYVEQESSPNYRQPDFNPATAYQPRMLQLGFRFVF